MTTIVLMAAQELRPAGGAALDQIIIASTAGVVLTAGLFLLGWGHRTGRSTILRRLATCTERWPFAAGQPGWVELPSTVALFSLIGAGIGLYWDLSVHLASGRDAGPLANPAHYPIMFGLFGIFASGVLAIVLPVGERPGPAAVRITGHWYAPVGGILLAAAGFFALLGFPFDDVWHRLFGQDVTLWGPTHLMLIGGGGLSVLGLAVLEAEGRLARGGAGATPFRLFLRRGMSMGGLLVGLSVFQGEWDLGLPQFRMVHQPLLIAVAAGCALVGARLWAGRGGAIFAVCFFVALRSGLAMIVGPILGEPLPIFPLFMVEALCVEAAALLLARRPLALGAASGVLIGTVGFAAEYAWTQEAFRLPWTPDILLEGTAMAVAGGFAGGVAGALLGLGLQGKLPRPALARSLFAGVLVVLTIGVANGLVITVPGNVRAEITLDADTGPGPIRTAHAAVRIVPPVQQPAWLTITSWQGGGLHVDHLVPSGDGSYRTTQPMPLSGGWKTMVRLQDGRTLSAVPIYLPADAVLGKPEIPAPPRITREAIHEQQILQRERLDGVPGWLWNTASAVVLVCSVLLVIALGWGVARISRASQLATRRAAPESLQQEVGAP